jgi:hypothetical protein
MKNSIHKTNNLFKYYNIFYITIHSHSFWSKNNQELQLNFDFMKL